MGVFKPGPANLFASLLSWLFDGYWPTPDRHEDGLVCVRGARRRYTPQRLLAVGDVADIQMATPVDDSDATAGTPYLLKVSRAPEGRAHLDVERKTLTKVLGLSPPERRPRGGSALPRHGPRGRPRLAAGRLGPKRRRRPAHQERSRAVQGLVSARSVARAACGPGDRPVPGRALPGLPGRR